MNINIHELGAYYVPDSVKGGICVDIGANCGSFSLKYANLFSKIHFYEPIKQLYNLCNDRLSEYKHIIGFNEAVYNKSGDKVSIFLHSNNDSGSSAIKSDIMYDKWKEDWTNNIIEKDVNTISLEEILHRLDNNDIDYMKVDCETSEYLFLLDKDLSKIKHLGIEIHGQLGEERWNELITHLLKYFNNPFNQSLSYNKCNKELYFINKKL